MSLIERDSHTCNSHIVAPAKGPWSFNIKKKRSSLVSSFQDGPFVWNELIQGLILSSYFWGYTVSMLPGGRLAELWSAKWLMNGSVLLNVAASILTPVAARTHYWLFIAMRFLQGIGGVSNDLSQRTWYPDAIITSSAWITGCIVPRYARDDRKVGAAEWEKRHRFDRVCR